MNERPLLTGRLLWGLSILTLGVLWTLDNLGQLDASRVVRWWPVLPLFWGVSLLTGLGGRRRTVPGWWWTVFGGLAILRPLGITSLEVFDFWPVIFILIGASLVYRAWTGQSLVHDGTETGARLNASVVLGGSERKVVTQEFASGEINAVIAGVTVDFRGSQLAGGRGVLDVFAMWGGIVLIVPENWRVEGEVSPILGAFQDSTSPPVDPGAPTLRVRGSVVMGAIEVRNHERATVRVRTRDEQGEGSAGPGFRVRTRDGRHEVSVGPGGVVIGRPSGKQEPDEE
jgi:hypothetical protein